MSSHIVTDFELSIKEGKLDDFKAVVNTMIELTDVNEPDTLPLFAKFGFIIDKIAISDILLSK